MRKEIIRGVNLGGWLVLERWITPSLFEGTDAKDEYSFMQNDEGAEKIKWHRRTFIAESDFAWLASNGINAVRIPVGYWLFEKQDGFTPTVEYLDWAFKMAEKYHLKVLVDLHAAHGSQNGEDHSGRAGKARWYRSPESRRATISVLKEIALRYKSSPALLGIELLNEPKLDVRYMLTLRRFYREAYAELEEILPENACIVFSDSFKPRLLSGWVRKGHVPVVLDIHWYQFGRTHIGKYFRTLANRKKIIDQFQRQQPIIIGEWSGMLSHKTLRGHSESEHDMLQKKHIDKQLDAYADALGWFYWTYKTESDGIWNFRFLVESGRFPDPRA